MRTERWFLGVDGGGTRTAAAAVDAHGRTRGYAEGPPSLRTVTGWAGSARAVAATIAALDRRTRRRARFAVGFFALAGIDAPPDARTASRHLRRELGTRVGEIRVVNDTAAALRAGTDAAHAAVVIAGTGSNALARGPRGTFHAGGWGRVMGDDGSGYWIGRAGLRAVVRALDGRGPRTALWPALARALGVRSLPALHDLLAEDGYPKRTVSQLSRTVDTLSLRDPIARSILHAAAVALADMAAASCRRAGLGRAPFPLVVSGGCFRAPVLLRAFRASVRRRLPHARIVRTAVEPAVGAAHLARDPH